MRLRETCFITRDRIQCLNMVPALPSPPAFPYRDTAVPEVFSGHSDNWKGLAYLMREIGIWRQDSKVKKLIIGIEDQRGALY